MKEVKQQHSLAKSDHENQIKGGKYIQDLSSFVHFISNKSDELEIDRKVKEPILELNESKH